MRILVTGADGFVGRHLSRSLREAGDEVVELSGPHGTGMRAVDITVPGAFDSLLKESEPEGIIHLAGFSSVAKSHKDPALAFLVNAQGTVGLLSSVKQHCPKARVLVIGSGEV